MDKWIKKVVTRHCKGRVLLRRYADDSVVCFERENDARAYLRVLPKRLEKFGLSLATEKSALVRFDRRAPEQSGKFTFLGFDFYWARARGKRIHRDRFIAFGSNGQFPSFLRLLPSPLRHDPKRHCGALFPAHSIPLMRKYCLTRLSADASATPASPSSSLPAGPS